MYDESEKKKKQKLEVEKNSINMTIHIQIIIYDEICLFISTEHFNYMIAINLNGCT